MMPGVPNKLINEDEFLKMIEQDDRYTAKDKKMILGGYSFYLDTGYVAGFFEKYIKFNRIDLKGLGTPKPSIKKSIANKIASSFDIINLGEGKLVPREKRVTNVWRRVPKSTHVGAIKWKKKKNEPSGKNANGTLFIAFHTGGSVYGNWYPVYKWDNIRYRTYEYIWKETQSPGSYLYHKMPKGNHIGNLCL